MKLKPFCCQWVWGPVSLLDGCT